MTTRIALVTAGMSEQSSTRLLADRIADAVVRDLDQQGRPAEVDVVELRPLGHALVDHLGTGFATGELAEALEAVRRADALVAVTPVFSASYSGLFKMFFDVIERDVLTGLPVLIAATAGTARHSLVLEHAMRPLFAHLRALVVPTAVFAASEDFGGGEGTTLQSRVDRAAGELATLLGGAERPPARRSSSETLSRRTMEEEFADPTPLEDLLSRMG